MPEPSRVPVLYPFWADCPDCGCLPSLQVKRGEEARWVWLCECGAVVVSEHG